MTFEILTSIVTAIAAVVSAATAFKSASAADRSADIAKQSLNESIKIGRISRSLAFKDHFLNLEKLIDGLNKGSFNGSDIDKTRDSIIFLRGANLDDSFDPNILKPLESILDAFLAQPTADDFKRASGLRLAWGGVNQNEVKNVFLAVKKQYLTISD